jgi:hypothetical protein
MFQGFLWPAFLRRSGACLEAPTVDAGFNDIAVMGETVKERGFHLGVIAFGTQIKEVADKFSPGEGEAQPFGHLYKRSISATTTFPAAVNPEPLINVFLDPSLQTVIDFLHHLDRGSMGDGFFENGIEV